MFEIQRVSPTGLSAAISSNLTSQQIVQTVQSAALELVRSSTLRSGSATAGIIPLLLCFGRLTGALLSPPYPTTDDLVQVIYQIDPSQNHIGLGVETVDAIRGALTTTGTPLHPTSRVLYEGLLAAVGQIVLPEAQPHASLKQIKAAGEITLLPSSDPKIHARNHEFLLRTLAASPDMTFKTSPLLASHLLGGDTLMTGVILFDALGNSTSHLVALQSHASPRGTLYSTGLNVPRAGSIGVIWCTRRSSPIMIWHSAIESLTQAQQAAVVDLAREFSQGRDAIIERFPYAISAMTQTGDLGPFIADCVRIVDEGLHARSSRESKHSRAFRIRLEIQEGILRGVVATDEGATEETVTLDFRRLQHNIGDLATFQNPSYELQWALNTTNRLQPEIEEFLAFLQTILR